MQGDRRVKLSERVRRLREAAGMTVAQLAERAKVSIQLVTEIEGDEVRSRRQLLRIAAVFDMSVDKLLEGCEPLAVRRGKAQKQPDRVLLYCSFCGRNQLEVAKLIAGTPYPDGSFACICDECVMLSLDVLLDDGKMRLTLERSDPRPPHASGDTDA